MSDSDDPSGSRDAPDVIIRVADAWTASGTTT